MKNMNKALAAYVEIRQTYFGDNPTKLSLDDLNTELIHKYDELPLVDIALVFQLVKTDHEMLQAKRNVHREPILPTFSAVQHRQCQVLQRNYKSSILN